MATSTSLGNFFKHTTIYAFGNVLNRAAAFLLLPIYTNYLSVSEYGALEMFYIVASVVSGLLSVGLAHATLRFYFEYETEAERNSVVTTNLTVSMLISMAGVTLVGFWYQPLAHYLFGGQELADGVLLILATLVLELSSQVSLAYLRAKEYSVTFVVIMFFKLVIQFAANTYFVVSLGLGVEGVLAGNLLAVAFGWVVLTIIVFRHCGYRFEWHKAVPVLRYSFPFLLSTITGLIAVNVDRLLIRGLLSLEALGIYALALKFSGLLGFLIGEPFNRSYGAFRFSFMGDSSAPLIQRRIVRYLLVALVAVGLGVILFSHDLLMVMSKPDYWPAANILPLLVLAALLEVINYPMQTGILYEKKTRFVFYIGVAGAVTSTVSSYLLIRWFGLLGACVAQVITAAVLLVVTNWISQQYFSVSYEYRRLIKVMMVAVFFYLLSLPLVGQSLLLSFPLKTALYLAFLGALLYSGALDREEIDGLRIRLLDLITRRAKTI